MDILSGRVFASMVKNGYKAIKLQYTEINDLNVFPVPDGDTGTNMTATLTGGIKSMEKADQSSLSEVASKLSTGMLLGARGNSGVILSQFFAGVSEGLSGLHVANVLQFASALRSGTTKAYSAVVKPVEGTILTVAREGCNYVLDNIARIKDFESLFKILLQRMERSLKKTPDLLPVLKEAGVIDSGGAGLVVIIQGMYKQLTGEELEDTIFNGPMNSISTDEEVPFNADSVLEYGYCTEFIMQLLNCKDGPAKFKLDAMIAFLETIGDSIVAIESDGIVKVHVHTKTPGKVIEYAQQFGEFVTFKMENMSIQHQEVLLKELAKEEPLKEAAIVAVAPSDAIAELFKQMGVTEIVKGGQTMNPSAEDFMSAFVACHAQNIIVFPNNGNVILTAKQAAELYKEARIEVISTKSAIECYSALGMVDIENQSIDENLSIIETQIQDTISGEVSIAVRDSVNNGLQIHENDYIGISQGAVKVVGQTKVDCLLKLIASIDDLDSRCILTVFYGLDVTSNEREQVEKAVQEAYPLMDFIEVEGEQSIYPFIIAVA